LINFVVLSLNLVEILLIYLR